MELRTQLEVATTRGPGGTGIIEKTYRSGLSKSYERQRDDNRYSNFKNLVAAPVLELNLVQS